MARGKLREAQHRYIKNLKKAIKRSHKKLETLSEARKRFIEAYVGPDYGDSAKRSTPAKNRALNMAVSAVSVTIPTIVANNPLANVTTPVRDLRSHAYTWELHTNKTVKRLRFSERLRYIVADSIFGVGIGRVGLAPGQTMYVDGEQIDVGQVYFDRVSIDRFVQDPESECREEAFFEGNSYVMPREYIFESELYENTAQIKDKVGTTATNQQQHQARELSNTHPLSDDRIVPVIELYDVFLKPPHPWEAEYPGIPVVITIIVDGSSTNDPLRVMPWYGSQRGPYELLGYYPVPDNPMPLPPAATWGALDELINVIARKLNEMATRTKKVLLYEPIAQEDMDKVRDAQDGEGIPVGNIDRFKEITLGGSDNQLMGFAQWLVAMFSRQAGNIDLLGGLSSDARTATEASFVQGNANARVQDMKMQVYHFVEEIIQKIAYFQWTDPSLNETVNKQIQGVPGIEVPVSLTAKGKRGKFLDYNFSVTPYSMDIRSPEEQVERMMQLVERIIFPTLQQAAAQGSYLNVDFLVQLAAKKLGVEECDELYIPGMPTSITESEIHKKQGGDEKPQVSGISNVARMATQGDRDAAGGEHDTRSAMASMSQPVGV